MCCSQSPEDGFYRVEAQIKCYISLDIPTNSINPDQLYSEGAPLSRFRLYAILTILKAIKNATRTSVIFHINNSLIHFVFVLTSVPNVGERFTKT